jgi:rhodanese-related sulfurtransferase
MRIHLVPALLFLCLTFVVTWLVRRWRRPAKIFPQRLQTLLSQGEPPLVLDVRSPDEFVGERGHIHEAVLSPLPELDTKLEELKAHRTRLIVTV